MKLGFFMYNKVFTVPRPRVVLRDEAHRVLLVRHWGSWRNWSLPGGGTKKGESAERAAQREVYEELGLEVNIEALQYLTTVMTDYAAPIYVVDISSSALPPQPHNQAEIMKAEWHDIHRLPLHMTRVAQKALTVLVKQG